MCLLAQYNRIILPLFCIRGNAGGCRTFLGETTGFLRGPEPVYGVPVYCGNGNHSISLSNALLLARITRLTQSAAGHKM